MWLHVFYFFEWCLTLRSTHCMAACLTGCTEIWTVALWFRRLRCASDECVSFFDLHSSRRMNGWPLKILLRPNIQCSYGIVYFRDEEEHSKKYHVPRRRRLGFPPITPNACVRDAVLQQVFDTTWSHVISCLSGPTDTKPTPLLKVNYFQFFFIFQRATTQLCSLGHFGETRRYFVTGVYRTGRRFPYTNALLFEQLMVSQIWYKPGNKSVKKAILKILLLDMSQVFRHDLRRGMSL